MGNCGAATALAYSPGSQTMSDCDPIAHLAPEPWENVVRLRFVPLSYLRLASDVQLDRGLDRLLYFQSLIDEEE